MGKLFPLAAALIAGLALGVQGPINSELSRNVGRFRAVLISVLVSSATVVIILLVHPGEGSFSGIFHTPRWAFVGGVLGVIILAGTIIAVPRIGAAATSGLIVTAQLIAAAIIDRFGLFDVAPRPITPPRLG